MIVLFVCFPSPAHFLLLPLFPLLFSLTNFQFLFFSSLSLSLALKPLSSSHSLKPQSSESYDKMGKYMNKSKIATDITVMEVFSQPTTTTVRTRAASKSLALQKLQKSSLPDAIPDLSFSYLQLRTRRLDKTNRSIGASAKQTSKPKKSARSSSSSVKTTSNLDCESQIVGVESQAENLEFEISRRYISVLLLQSWFWN